MGTHTGNHPHSTVRPFLKWAGGKRRLLYQLMHRLPLEWGNYYEPFLGGGALMLAISAKRRGAAFAGDLCEELILTWAAVQRYPQNIIQRLRAMRPTPEDFARIRAEQPTDPVEVAARMIYLNRTCFNGLYRVNKSGQFNVPFGRFKGNPLVAAAKYLQQVTTAIHGVTFMAWHFADTVADAVAGDLVYFDPPYYESEWGSFTLYTAEGFGPEDHRELADVALDLDRRGVKVMLSNSDVPAVRKLYAGWHIDKVKAQRSISARADRRRKVGELIIRNYRRASEE